MFFVVFFHFDELWGLEGGEGILVDGEVGCECFFVEGDELFGFDDEAIVGVDCENYHCYGE